MTYEVTLRWHQDDNTGYWGVCPANSVGIFDAFWEPAGIFHDVFEHFFEGHHPYFSDQYMHTVFGEMAASGAGIAYSQIGVNNFKYRDTIGNGRDFIADTQPYLENWLNEDFGNFPIDRKLCIVPRQRQPNSLDFSYWINQYIDWWETTVQEHSKLRRIPKSVIRNCYAWGFNYVQDLLKDRDHAFDVLDGFLDKWYRITGPDGYSEHNNYVIASEEAYPLKGFKFRITSVPQLTVDCMAVDEINNEFPLELLETY